MEEQEALESFSNEIDEAMKNQDVNQVMRAPAPFFNRYLERMFGNEFESELLEAFGVSEDATNNHKEIGRYITSYATVSILIPFIYHIWSPHIMDHIIWYKRACTIYKLNMVPRFAMHCTRCVKDCMVR